MILSNIWWYQSKPTSLENMDMSAYIQQIWVVACKTRPEVLYKQAKVALDSFEWFSAVSWVCSSTSDNLICQVWLSEHYTHIEIQTLSLFTVTIIDLCAARCGCTTQLDVLVGPHLWRIFCATKLRICESNSIPMWKNEPLWLPYTYLLDY